MWISAVINPYGTPARVVDAVIGGQILAMVSQLLLDELTAVLIRPKFRRWLSVPDAVAFVETLGAIAEHQDDPQLPAPRRVRGPDDDYLVALAEKTGAVLVTGDADLPDAELHPPAITPRTLLELLQIRQGRRLP